MAAAIERLEADLALAEEPARFAGALAQLAPAPGAPPPTSAAAGLAGVPPPDTLRWLAAEIRAGRVSPVEATRECLARIDKMDGRLRAYITVDAAGALAAARAREEEARAGRWRGALHGVPLAVKDLCALRGLPTSCGTRTAEYFVSAEESTAARRLLDAGAVLLGKLNMSELALGPFGDNLHHGDCQNPWRPGHCAGGSSSGSGAAVAAGLAWGALGTDTGGSIRLPAACCGIVGLKPTYGRVSRAGVMPLSWSLDHVGPMARSVADAALLLDVIAGADPRDATASGRSVPDALGALGAGVVGLRVGLVEGELCRGVDAAMLEAVGAAARALEAAGARVEPLRVPDPQPLADVANVLARAESAVLHARVLRERPHELQPVVRGRLEIGARVTAHDYLQAQRLRASLTRRFVEEVFAGVDVLVAPVIPEVAPSFAAIRAGSLEDQMRRTGAFARLTRPFNTLGLPAVAVPCGLSPEGLPRACQLVARPFDEPTALRAALAVEAAVGLGSRRPPAA